MRDWDKLLGEGMNDLLNDIAHAIMNGDDNAGELMERLKARRNVDRRRAYMHVVKPVEQVETNNTTAEMNGVGVLLDKKVEENNSIPNLLEPNQEWWGLTEAEEEVFKIRRSDWPRLLAIWAVYEAVLEIAYHEWDSEEEQVFQQFLNSEDWLTAGVVDLLQFQRFGKLFGYSYRETKAVYEKQYFQNIAYTTYQDEHN